MRRLELFVILSLLVVGLVVAGMTVAGCGGVDPGTDDMCIKGTGSSCFAADLAGQGDPDGGGGKQPFLWHCGTDDDCQMGLTCGQFPAKGGGFCTYHCTMATAAADCPAPSTGCNNMGICKVP